jgi:hypothetical protein
MTEHSFYSCLTLWIQAMAVRVFLQIYAFFGDLIMRYLLSKSIWVEMKSRNILENGIKKVTSKSRIKIVSLILITYELN